MKVVGGLCWPEEGNPAFFCLATEKTKTIVEKAIEPEWSIEISNEIEENSLIDVLDEVKKIKNLQGIYAYTDKKYLTHMKDFSIWRRENSSNVILRTSRASSFEAGVLKIKDFVKKKQLILPAESIIKDQLKVFSKMSLKNENDYYAVSALTNVITAFVKEVPVPEEKAPSLKGWF